MSAIPLWHLDTPHDATSTHHTTPPRHTTRRQQQPLAVAPPPPRRYPQPRHTVSSPRRPASLPRPTRALNHAFSSPPLFTTRSHTVKHQRLLNNTKLAIMKAELLLLALQALTAAACTQSNTFFRVPWQELSDAMKCNRGTAGSTASKRALPQDNPLLARPCQFAQLCFYQRQPWVPVSLGRPPEAWFGIMSQARRYDGQITSSALRKIPARI